MMSRTAVLPAPRVAGIDPARPPGHPGTQHHNLAAHPRYAVEVVRDEAAFEALAPAWNDTVERAGILHPFLRHEWVRTWWQCFGRGAQLHVLLVRHGGRLVAIAPLMRDVTSMYGMPVRRVRFIQNDHTPRTDVIVASDVEESCRAIWNSLLQDPQPWDLLQLNQLEHSSPTRRIFAALAAANGHASGEWTSGDSPYLTLTGDFEEYLTRLPAKFRSNLRNRLARLNRLGEPALEVLTEADAIVSACADAWRLEDSGWKRQAGTAIESNEDVHRFYTELIPRATAAGWMRLMFLTAGGRRIATSYGACFGNRLLLFKTGYDPEFAGCAPFKLLTYFAIRRACADGLEEVDFLGDAEPWKLEWTSTVRGHDWLFVFADTVRARLLHSIKFHWGPELKRWQV